jgi:DNA-binding NarL/FixJ family response regulator
MGMTHIRVFIADDHNMVRKGLQTLLEEFDDLEVIGEAGDGEAALNACRDQCPDVILMDMLMPRMDGITATSKIREVCPKAQVIALTSFSDEANVQAALKAGVIGYLMKNVSGDELASAIRRAHEGQSTLAPEAAQVLIKATTRPPTPGHDLTERELEVLALMKEGLNNREIGERLVISGSTVKNHVSSILSKLGTTSRTQAVALAVEHRIVE